MVDETDTVNESIESIETIIQTLQHGSLTLLYAHYHGSVDQGFINETTTFKYDELSKYFERVTELQEPVAFDCSKCGVGLQTVASICSYLLVSYNDPVPELREYLRANYTRRWWGRGFFVFLGLVGAMFLLFSLSASLVNFAWVSALSLLLTVAIAWTMTNATFQPTDRLLLVSAPKSMLADHENRRVDLPVYLRIESAQDDDDYEIGGGGRHILAGHPDAFDTYDFQTWRTTLGEDETLNLYLSQNDEIGSLFVSGKVQRLS